MAAVSPKRKLLCAWTAGVIYVSVMIYCRAKEECVLLFVCGREKQNNTGIHWNNVRAENEKKTFGNRRGPPISRGARARAR